MMFFWPDAEVNNVLCYLGQTFVGSIFWKGISSACGRWSLHWLDCEAKQHNLQASCKDVWQFSREGKVLNKGSNFTLLNRGNVSFRKLRCSEPVIFDKFCRNHFPLLEKKDSNTMKEHKKSKSEQHFGKQRGLIVEWKISRMAKVSFRKFLCVFAAVLTFLQCLLQSFPKFHFWLSFQVVIGAGCLNFYVFDIKYGGFFECKLVPYIIGGCAGFVVLVVVMVLACCCRKRKTKHQSSPRKEVEEPRPHPSVSAQINPLENIKDFHTLFQLSNKTEQMCFLFTSSTDIYSCAKLILLFFADHKWWEICEESHSTATWVQQAEILEEKAQAFFRW